MSAKGCGASAFCVTDGHIDGIMREIVWRGMVYSVDGSSVGKVTKRTSCE